MKITKYELTDQAGLQQIKLPGQAKPLNVGLEDAKLYLYALTLEESEAVDSMGENAAVDQRIFLGAEGEAGPSVPLDAGQRTRFFLGTASGKWAFWLGPVPKAPTI